MNVQKTREARNKSVVIYTKFCQCKELHKTALFCFYEGEDAKYYGNRVEQFTARSNDGVVSFNCGGKAGVLKVKEMLKAKEQYQDVKKAFFIDSDFFPQKDYDTDVYQTEGYSVENYYTSISAFTRILHYAFGINCSSSDYGKCLNDYESRMKEFHNCVMVLNAWIKAQRKNELKSGKRDLELTDFKVAKYFDKMSIDSISVKTVIDKKFLEEYFADLNFVEETEVEKYVEEFKSINMQQFFRGKFELEFLKKIIEDLRTKNKKGDYFAEHYECVKIDPNVDPLLILSQFADTPDSLIMFLKQFSIDKAA